MVLVVLSGWISDKTFTHVVNGHAILHHLLHIRRERIQRNTGDFQQAARLLDEYPVLRRKAVALFINTKLVLVPPVVFIRTVSVHDQAVPRWTAIEHRWVTTATGKRFEDQGFIEKLGLVDPHAGTFQRHQLGNVLWLIQ